MPHYPLIKIRNLLYKRYCRPTHLTYPLRVPQRRSGLGVVYVDVKTAQGRLSVWSSGALHVCCRIDGPTLFLKRDWVIRG